MQVYKCFFQILKKQKGQIIMYLSIFVALSIITSTQGKNNEEMKFEASTYKFAVFDEDRTEMSKGLTSYLSSENEIVEIADDKETVQDELYNRNIHCAIRIKQGYGDALREGKGEGMLVLTAVPGTIYGEASQQAVTSYSAILSSYLMGGFSDEQALSQTEKTVKQKVKVTLADGAKDSFSTLYYFFKYLPYIYLAICVVAIGPVLIVFHKKEVKNRIISSPYSMRKANLELYAGMLTTGLGLMMIHLIIVIAFRAGIFSGRGALFMLNELCFLAVPLGIVFLIGQIVSNSSVLSMIANVVGLGMSFLGGIFVPLSLMGDGVVAAAHALPSYWYVRACQEIDGYVAGGSLSSILSCMGMQLLFGLAFICIGMAYSRGKETGQGLTAHGVAG